MPFGYITDVLKMVVSHVERSLEYDSICVADSVKDKSQSLKVSYGNSMKALRAALSGLKVFFSVHLTPFWYDTPFYLILNPLLV